MKAQTTAYLLSACGQRVGRGRACKGLKGGRGGGSRSASLHAPPALELLLGAHPPASPQCLPGWGCSLCHVQGVTWGGARGHSKTEGLGMSLKRHHDPVHQGNHGVDSLRCTTSHKIPLQATKSHQKVAQEGRTYPWFAALPLLEISTRKDPATTPPLLPSCALGSCSPNGERTLCGNSQRGAKNE